MASDLKNFRSAKPSDINTKIGTIESISVFMSIGLTLCDAEQIRVKSRTKTVDSRPSAYLI